MRVGPKECGDARLLGNPRSHLGGRISDFVRASNVSQPVACRVLVVGVTCRASPPQSFLTHHVAINISTAIQHPFRRPADAQTILCAAITIALQARTCSSCCDMLRRFRVCDMLYVRAVTDRHVAPVVACVMSTFTRTKLPYFP